MIRKGDILANLIDSDTREWGTYEKVTSYWDGSPMDDSKVDGKLYRKLGTEYFKSVQFGNYNVKFFGAKGDGVTDDTAAIQAAIDAVPDRVRGPNGDSVFVTYRANKIYFPLSSGAYICSGKLTVPPWKNVIFTTDMVSGVAIDWTSAPGGVGIEFQPGGVGRIIGIENLRLRHAGVDIIGGNSGSILFRNMQVDYAPVFGIRTIDANAIGYDGPNESGGINNNRIVFEYCDFTYCYNPMRIEASTYLLNTIRKCRFNVNRSAALTLDCAGVVVDDCEFQLMYQGDGEQPFIHFPLTRNPTEHIIIRDCRFGPEVSGLSKHPNYPIVVGNIGSYVPVSNSFGNVEIYGNKFFGSQDNTSSGILELNARASGLNVHDNYMRQYSGHLVKDGYYNEGTGNVNVNNVWENNYIFGNTQLGIFSPALSTFQSQKVTESRAITQSNASVLPGILPGANNIMGVSWNISANLTKTQDATDPFNVPNNAITLTRTAAGNASIRQQLNFPVTGPLAFGVWLKAGEVTRATIRVFAGTTPTTRTLLDEPISLTPYWKYYTFSTPHLTEASTPSIWIYNDIIGSSLTAGSIYMFRPTCTNSEILPDTVLDYVYGSGGIRDVQLNSLVLGSNHIGYGDAAPTTGQHMQGDMVYNIAPVAGGQIGWVCVTTGAPGTWKPFGTIEV